MLKPIVIGLGGGADSVKATLDVLRDPIALKYLRQGAVMMAQTGAEWSDTKKDLEEVLFPRLREKRIRTIQVARKGPLQEQGVAVLDDTDQPTTCYTRPTKANPYYGLGKEMMAAGTIPQMSGARKCSQKAKGVPLDWAREELVTRGQPYLHLIGFEVNEAGRIQKDKAEDTELRCGWYPLAEQGLDRAACLTGIKAETGRDWDKSACTYCLIWNLGDLRFLVMTLIIWDKFPLVAGHEHARRWLQFTANIGRASNTVVAYGRAVEDHLRFCALVGADPLTVRADVVAAWIGALHERPNPRASNLAHFDSGVGLANATIQQYVVAARSFYQFLVEDELRERNPVRRGESGRRLSWVSVHGSGVRV